MYSPVSRTEIIEALAHIRGLYRQKRRTADHEVLIGERREAVIRDLISNLTRTSEHPTLRTLFDVAESCFLTLEGVHRLFGYDLRTFRDYDSLLNGDRTHIFESYPFERDLRIDLPVRFASHTAFESSASLRDLVQEWRTGVPLRSLEEDEWERPGTFYIRIGTEDSLGSSIPPGAIASVEPISEAERSLPNPRSIYLLQFGNGYRCSRCLVSRGRLLLLDSERNYRGRKDYPHPGTVRIAGRIRMFAMSLPMPEYQRLYSLPDTEEPAELILPWEHTSRYQLLATKRKRFKRTRQEEQFAREFLKQELNAKLSPRSERRYLRASSSKPHVNALIHLSVANLARYTDALRTGGFWFSDRGRFSLDALLRAKQFDDVSELQTKLDLPKPNDVWEARRKEFGGWPPLLSVTFPELRQWDERFVRLADGAMPGYLNPSIAPGSWLLTKSLESIPNVETDRRKVGWSRPIYLLRRGLEMICGYLERDGEQLAIISREESKASATFQVGKLEHLNLVVGVAVPIQ